MNKNEYKKSVQDLKRQMIQREEKKSWLIKKSVLEAMLCLDPKYVQRRRRRLVRVFG